MKCCQARILGVCPSPNGVDRMRACVPLGRRYLWENSRCPVGKKSALA